MSKEPTAAAASILVTMREQTGEITKFRVKPTMKMAKLWHKYEQRKGVTHSTYRYLIDGVGMGPPDGEKTIREIVCADEDAEGEDEIQIDCFLEQEGGGAGRTHCVMVFEDGWMLATLSE
mmetsp:Transcript_15745/g.35059  ORF Transcript_15745/g.35059 Transcript_15745/m.35059 type:complete len:120 (+) Transcript_15745:231-590(+)|eukprot:CAMPEP_0178486576 /NCGR_PEP_ID=MMETSP0696-20121128/8877_1 /TAXON_ID=265572 /ORGANISM="Extubocellulus spinifer, Strain CCMP396" /LENGTH=119 /DNA_ID=CAMNT_0020114241 /DNA_START=258 /DNA_END=617 /DNA_ORIENTATION=+